MKYRPGKFLKINTSWTMFNATTKISAGMDNKWYDSYLKKIHIKGTIKRRALQAAGKIRLCSKNGV